MVDILDEIICHILLPYLIDDCAFRTYLDLAPEKKSRYLRSVVHAYIGRSVTTETADYFVNTLSKGDNIDDKMIDASRDGHLPIVQYLIEVKANIHAGEDGALRCAAENGHLPVVQYLIEAKANIRTNDDNDDDVALRWAAYNGHLPVVRYLIEAKANVHANNDEALRWAAEKGHSKVIDYLRSR